MYLFGASIFKFISNDYGFIFSLDYFKQNRLFYEELSINELSKISFFLICLSYFWFQRLQGWWQAFYLRPGKIDNACSIANTFSGIKGSQSEWTLQTGVLNDCIYYITYPFHCIRGTKSSANDFIHVSFESDFFLKGLAVNFSNSFSRYFIYRIYNIISRVDGYLYVLQKFD